MLLDFTVVLVDCALHLLFGFALRGHEPLTESTQVKLLWHLCSPMSIGRGSLPTYCGAAWTCRSLGLRRPLARRRYGEVGSGV